MTRSPTPPAGRYLDVARTLGVSDAVLRRHHGVGADASLRATLAGDLSSPTDELVTLLAASGAVLDLDAVDPADASPLALRLAHFGYDAECSEVAGEVEVVATDVVTDDVEHVRAEPAAEPLRSALRERVLDGTGVEAVELVDGRTLVADARSLGLLRDRYGPRIEPFETPLLATAVEVDAPVAADQTASATAEPASGRAPGSPAPAPYDDSNVDGVAPDEGTSFGDVLASADDSEAEAIEGALAAGGPRVHTAEEESADLDRAAEDVGGGPRRTVSSTGIDEVFADLEAAAASGASGRRGRASADATDDDPFTQPMHADDGASDAQPDATAALDTDATAAPDADATAAPDTDAAAAPDAGSADSNDGPFVGGGPTRTVSETSADDILQRVSGHADFEDIADEEGEADPDAVLDDAEEIPDIAEEETDGESATDGGAVSTRDEDGPSPANTDDELTDGAGNAAVEPARDDSSAHEPARDDSSADEPDAGPTASTDGPASTDCGDPDSDDAGCDDADNAGGDDADDADGDVTRDAADTSVTPADAAGAGDTADTASDGDTAASTPTSDAAASTPTSDAAASTGTEDGDDLDDALVGDDVEVRGSETVDPSETPDVSVERGSRAGRRSTDGPLARTGGVSPSPSADASASTTDGPAADDATADEARVAADGEADADPDGGDSASLLERVRSVFRR